MTTRPLRVGIVSAGWGAFAHLPAWRAVRGVEVTAICTSRRETAEAAQAKLGLPRAFWNAAAMCADPEIDIVDLGTRPSVRLPMVLDALAHGKHVYNASPHAPDWAGALAIDAAWRKSGRVGVVDAFARWIPAHRQMAALLANGVIGQPIGGTCLFNISLFNAPDRRFAYNWFADGSAGVSAMRNNGSHLLYLLLELFGPVAELVADDRRVLDEWVFADGGRVVPENTDFGSAILRFSSGMTLQLQASWSHPAGAGWAVDIFGSKGRLVARSPSFPTARDCTLHFGTARGALEAIDIPAGLHADRDVALTSEAAVQPSYPMALSMHAMVEAIGGQGRPQPDFAAALEVERVQEAMRVSNRERRWVNTGEFV